MLFFNWCFHRMLPTEQQQKQVYCCMCMEAYLFPFVDGDIWLQTAYHILPTMFRELLETIRHILMHSDSGLGKQTDLVQVKALPFQSIKAKLRELKYPKRALQMHHSHNPFLSLSLIMTLGDMYREREVEPANFVWHRLQSKTCSLPQLNHQRLGFISQFVVRMLCHEMLLLNLSQLLNKILWSNNLVISFQQYKLS